MAGRPPNAREGEPSSSAGRPIIAGVAPFERRLSPRATASDLWASLESSFTDPHGFDRLENTHGSTIDRRARLRARAYLNQARQYYRAISELEPVAKPLPAYYFALNLTKAFLTIVDPATTATSLMHGLSNVPATGTNYSFQRERMRIQPRGVFRLLAERTGMGHCWGSNYQLSLADLMPYLPEAVHLYADAYGTAPRLLPVEDVRVLFDPAAKEAWLRIDISKAVMQQRRITTTSLAREARIIGDRFRFVHTKDDRVHSLELTTPLTYPHRKSDVLEALVGLFDECLIACDRSFPGARRYVVLSTRTQLLSHEAVTFAVLHHLSNMVRYRPNDAEHILLTRHAWLLTSWVDRASEGLLLNLASRVTREEHIVV